MSGALRLAELPDSCVVSVVAVADLVVVSSVCTPCSVSSHSYSSDSKDRILD